MIIDYRSTMTSWTQDDSKILSVLLDDVVGTQEMVEIRQDYCRIDDSIWSELMNPLCAYFTGSKAEGLNLPGSDEDYMYDINREYNIKVTQSLDENSDTSHYSIFYMSTENVYPCFALLQHVPQTPMDAQLFLLYQNTNGLRYLSSDLIVQDFVSDCNSVASGGTVKRQGPSAEVWTRFAENACDCGVDNVASIHCTFWPNEASEWLHRPRHSGWPTSQDVSSIIDFGFHLVPVGHPHSARKELEWRISFSVAERTLVWSFNHVQMQCYAVMKIILKEFIKVKCNPQNQVLCSYFIKTFLFWKYESTELKFWREDNLGECFRFLLAEFSKCIQEGVLRHYFIPRFNLLSIKLTREAQAELMQLFDIIIQSDISILRECRTLCDILSEFLQVRGNRNYDNVRHKKKKLHLPRTDDCVMKYICRLYLARLHVPPDASNLTNQLLHAVFPCITPLRILVLIRMLFKEHFSSLQHKGVHGNKGVYQLRRTAQNDTWSFDISTSKLFCASLLFKKGDFSSTLNIINQVLSNIPPFLMYNYNVNLTFVDTEAKQLYADMFLDSDVTMIQRAKKAWISDLLITKDMIDVVPLAIQIELHFFDLHPIPLSPFTCAYYLQFLCYHRMQQYENRDSALRQLIEVVFNREQCSIHYFSINIAGHCLLLAGKRDQARAMFIRSHSLTQQSPAGKFNPALWYLQNCF